MNPARLVFPALRWRSGGGFTHEDRNIDEALALGVGGFIVFGVPGGTAEEFAALVTEIRRRVSRPLLIAADFERGAGQQALGRTECPPPRALAALKDPAVVRWAGHVTGLDAAALGVDLVFAPVADLDVAADNPIVQTRAFSEDPRLTADCVAEWITGCQSAGVLACAKHYPGHGRTVRDSHAMLPQVEADARTLLTTDLEPFRAALNAGVAAIMTAHVAYPALDPSGVPATFSAPILGHLRNDLGFEGAVVTDALIMEAAGLGGASGEAAARAIRAGCDLLLYPPDPPSCVEALSRAVASDAVAAERFDEAERRYSLMVELAQRSHTRPASPDTKMANQVADRLVAQGLIRGEAPALATPLVLKVVDDDLQSTFPPGPSDYVAKVLSSAGALSSGAGQRVVLAFAEPRAGKGRAGFGDESRRALERLVPDASLVVLFGHARLVEQIPGDAPVLVAWHRQRLMQEAVGRWLVRETGDRRRETGDRRQESGNG